MRVLFYILMILAVASCNADLVVKDEWKGVAGVDECARFKKMATHCLRDWLIGEDSAGVWEVLTQPVGAQIDTLLIGDNPCIEWNDQPCGQYELMYIVGDDCCRDTAVVRPLKCCLVANSSCD